MARAIQGFDTIKKVMDKYSSTSTEFFSLKDDGDTATVRFIHKDDKDLDIYIVHKVKLAGRDRYVYCPTSEDKPCPLCKAGLRPAVRIFLTLEDDRDGKRKLWDRGKTEIGNILGLISRYGDLSSRKFDIVRHGKKGDSKTTYQFFPHDPDNVQVDERQPIVGPNAFVLEKTEEELNELLNEIQLPSQSNQYNYQSQSSQSTQRPKMF